MQMCGDSWWMIFFSQPSRKSGKSKVSPAFFFLFVLQHHQPEVLGPLWTNHLQDTTASQWPLHWISFSKLAPVHNRNCSVPPCWKREATCCSHFHLALCVLKYLPFSQEPKAVPMQNLGIIPDPQNEPTHPPIVYYRFIPGYLWDPQNPPDLSGGYTLFMARISASSVAADCQPVGRSNLLTSFHSKSIGCASSWLGLGLLQVWIALRQPFTTKGLPEK